MVMRVSCISIKQICQFKAKDNINWHDFCLGSASKNLTKHEQSELSLNGTVYAFPVNNSSFKKEDILNIHQYLIVKII